MLKDPKIAPRLIVFSDLDGTLLDHESYSWDLASPALDQMLALGIPLVLASSKTAAEIADLRSNLGFEDAPADRSAHSAICAALSDLDPDLRRCFTGFSDWTIHELAQQTGLSLDQAKSAARRQFSEPGLWRGTPEQRAIFETNLAQNGIFARQGGRYLTLSMGAIKADRMAEIVARFDPKPVTMALGDAPNDVEMIRAADHGVVVMNSHGPGLPALEGEATGRITRTVEPGPKGWNTAVLDRIAQLYTERG